MRTVQGHSLAVPTIPGNSSKKICAASRIIFAVKIYHWIRRMMFFGIIKDRKSNAGNRVAQPLPIMQEFLC
jgi:hypothetical protein